jgi:hypothetical protein
VTLSGKVTKSDATGATWLTVTAHQATGLRSADFFGRNDVYVQCYKIPSSTNKSDPMPPPSKKLESNICPKLPASNLMHSTVNVITFCLSLGQSAAAHRLTLLPNESINPSIAAAAISLEQGQHRFPFKIKIPSNNMPSSYERCFRWNYRGYVRYSLYANVDIKYCRDPSTRMFITVLGSDCPRPCLLSPSEAQEQNKEM